MHRSPVSRLRRFAIRPASCAAGFLLFGGGLLALLLGLLLMVESAVSFASSRYWWLLVLLLPTIALVVTLAIGSGREAARALRSTQGSACGKLGSIGAFFLVGASAAVGGFIALAWVWFLPA